MAEKIGSANQAESIFNINGISFVNEQFGTAVGDTGKILNTTNGGINWTFTIKRNYMKD